MLALIGGGRVSSYIGREACLKGIYFKCYSSRNNNKYDNINYSSIIQVPSIVLKSSITNCLINWSHTYPRNIKDLKRSIIGFQSIAKMIDKHPKVKFTFVSSTSAERELLDKSIYGSSKRLGETILLESNLTRSQEFKVRIVRPGLIYGLESCPIHQIIKLYKKRIKLNLGREDANFAVTSINDFTEFALNSNSEFWNSNKDVFGFYEKEPYSLNDIHNSSSSYAKTNKLNITLTNRSILYKIMELLGISIDLSLASIDRFPSTDSIVYNYSIGFDKYIKNLCIE